MIGLKLIKSLRDSRHKPDSNENVSLASSQLTLHSQQSQQSWQTHQSTLGEVSRPDEAREASEQPNEQTETLEDTTLLLLEGEVSSDEEQGRGAAAVARGAAGRRRE